MIRSTLTILAFLTAAALPATAQQVLDRDAARGQLFDARGAVVVVTAHAFLTQADIATLGALPEVAQLKYYGAMAASPAEGLQSERTQGAFNFHSSATARAAALAACGAGCVVVADILPRGHAAGRALTLNQDATQAVDGRAFRRAGANAALAVSASTGAWGLGDGGPAAIAACAAQGASDCRVAVAR